MTCPNCGSEKEPAGIQTLWCPDCGAEANLDDTAEFKTPEPQSNLDERIQQAKQIPPGCAVWIAEKHFHDRNAVAGWFYNAAELGLPEFADIAYDISRMGYLVTVTIGDKISTDFIPKTKFLELPDKNAFRHFVNGMVFRMVNEFPA